LLADKGIDLKSVIDARESVAGRLASIFDYEIANIHYPTNSAIFCIVESKDDVG